MSFMEKLDGKALQEHCIEELNKQIPHLPRAPKLVAILVGDNPASKRYVEHKARACLKAGIQSEIIELAASSTTEEVLQIIQRCSHDDKIDGILLQLPLPGQDENILIDAIDPSKDVDGLTTQNMGKLLLGRDNGLLPCTPKGILQLLQHYHIDTSGKKVVIVGRSNIVGKPLAALLMQKKYGNATVTIAHSGTKELKNLCKEAEILIAAIGSPKFITEEFIGNGSIAIDVGINEYKLERGVKLVGDIDPLALERCSYYSPVPGGVGPMTIASLLQNTYLAYVQRKKL